MQDWKMTIKLTAKDFNNLKHIARYIFETVSQAKSWKEFPIAGGGSSGMNGNDYGYSVEYTCPIEDKIASLRAEADALEISLGQGKKE